MLTDTIVGFCICSTILGVTMFMQFRLYKRQQILLEQTNTELVKQNHAKGIFLANMSHEIRTPINVILGMSEMIQRSSPQDEVKSYSTNIINAGNLLLSVVNNNLDITKIESGKIVLKNQPYRVDVLIMELTAIGMELAKKKNLAFKVDVDENIPSMLVGDKNHIRQIITNFVSNAVKYTIEGTGLGLAITKQFAEAMNGTVKPEVNNNLGNEAVSLVEPDKYDIIYLDYMMPEMDGIETLNEIRKNGDKKVPIVALTADAIAGTEERMLEAGFSQYIAKPVKWNDLEKSILSFLNSSKVIRNTKDDNDDSVQR